MPDLPKIAERFLMTTSRPRPFFSMKEMELLVEALRVARQYATTFEQAQDAGSEACTKAVAFQSAIDDFAEELTGERTYFQAPAASQSGIVA